MKPQYSSIVLVRTGFAVMIVVHSHKYEITLEGQGLHTMWSTIYCTYLFDAATATSGMFSRLLLQYVHAKQYDTET